MIRIGGVKTKRGREVAKLVAPRAAMVNALVVAVVVAVAAAISRIQWPWWVSDTTVIIVVGAAATGLGLFKYLFGAQLQADARALTSLRWTRYAAIGVLGAEIVLIIVLGLRPRPHTLRIVPGPLLSLQLGYPAETLRVELDGRVFELDAPPRGAVYLGGGEERVRYWIGQESQDNRNDALKDVLLSETWGLNPLDESEITRLIKLWTKGDPVVMRRTSAKGQRGPVAMFIDRGRVRNLKLSKPMPERGERIETYVAELPD